METAFAKIFNANKNRNRQLMQDAFYRVQEAGDSRNAAANARAHMIFLKLKNKHINNLVTIYQARNTRLAHLSFQRWKHLSTKDKVQREIES